MYCEAMAQKKDPAVRSLLLERAARMLASREPVTLRSLVAGTGVSTMAVYTYFDGMDGLWKALRQEGFTVLTAALAHVPSTDDPIQDHAALGAAYLEHARRHPDLYRVMFDSRFELEDAPAADGAFEFLITTLARARDAGRIRQDVVPLDLAVQSWVVGHGLASLVVTGPLPLPTLSLGAPMLTALLTAAGDDPDRCRDSVNRGWSGALG